MSARPQQGRGRGCTGECGYQRLYEGSQASLNDMAAKHTHALSRVTALRSGVLHVMKETFPSQFSETERRMGRKLSAEADSVLLALLRGFAHTHAGRSQSPAAGAAPGTEELREALRGLGVDVPAGADLGSWAFAVRAARQPATPPTALAPHSPAAVTSAAPSRAVGPVATVAAQDASDDVAGLETLFGLEPPADEPAPVFDLGNLFDDAPEVGERASADTDDTDDPQELFDLLYGQAPASDPAARAASVDPPVVVEPTPSADPAEAPQRQQPNDGNVKGAGSARTAASVVKPEMFPVATVPKAAGRGRRTPTKSPRVTAAPPAADEPAAAPAEVATDRFGELLALVAQPKPVFMSDLVAASGSTGLVAAWEQEIGDQSLAAPVRVIAPRGHHRGRGALVIPHSEDLREALTANGRTCWSDCLEDGPDRARLRGARLYEAAVVLHRFSSEIVSYRRSKNVLSLRLNTSAGLTGVVLWIGGDTPAGPERAALTDAVEEMIGDRMVMLAVLTPETGARAVERLAGLLAEDAAERKWQPTMPVVASHSWEFASDGGASAVSVL